MAPTSAHEQNTSTAVGVPLQQQLNLPQSEKKQKKEKLHVLFLHLDWGIGGAEQLMLQLCVASVQSGHSVELFTTRCDPNHCFALLKEEQKHIIVASAAPPDDAGSTTSPTTTTPVVPTTFFPFLNVWGKWIPAHVYGKGQALCSTVRLLYLALAVARQIHHRQNNKNDDTSLLIVLDVLPTPLWILRFLTPASLLFYCHFPDQLLILTNDSDSNKAFSGRGLYRSVLNLMEEGSMRLADTIAVNSQFTQTTVIQTFHSLRNRELPVLYPALDIGTTTTTTTATTPQRPDGKSDDEHNVQTTSKDRSLLVSLNRFERKKNLGLLIEAAAWIRMHQPATPLPTIVIAGGYDPRNVENVEYRAELGHLATKHNVAIDFRSSISDAERQALLTTALVVVYTPTNEHFGIVPIEAMYAGTAVVASNSGGPMETVKSGTTGILCQEATPASFGMALAELLQHPDTAIRMGQAGRDHVIQNFMPDRLQREWMRLTEETVAIGQARRRQEFVYRVASPRTLWMVVDALLFGFLGCLLLTGLLRLSAILHPTQSILGGVRQVLQKWNNGEL